MSEDESTERASTEAVETGTGRRPGSARAPDDAAAAFLALDSDLDTKPNPTTGTGCGLVVDAERVDRTVVPEGYPLGARTEDVLALTVDTGLDERTVYLAWPDETADVPLVWYLDARGIELCDLYGRGVQLQRTEGHTVLATPDEPPRGSPRWQAGVLVGYALTAALVVSLPVVDAMVGSPLHLLWAALTLVGLPTMVYKDAWYARTHSDWDGSPRVWATLSALPFLNLVSVTAYGYSRSTATAFGHRTSLRTRLLGAVRSLL